MAVLRFYNPATHDIYHYPVVATQTSGGITPDGYSSECQTNGVQDGSVDAADIGKMLAGWGGRNPLLDLDGDFRVDAPDLSKLLAAWGSYPMQTNTQAPPPPPIVKPTVSPTDSTKGRDQTTKRRI